MSKAMPGGARTSRSRSIFCDKAKFASSASWRDRVWDCCALIAGARGTHGRIVVPPFDELNPPSMQCGAGAFSVAAAYGQGICMVTREGIVSYRMQQEISVANMKILLTYVFLRHIFAGEHSKFAGNDGRLTRNFANPCEFSRSFDSMSYWDPHRLFCSRIHEFGESTDEYSISR
jgi:hypothetical protein